MYSIISVPLPGISRVGGLPSLNVTDIYSTQHPSAVCTLYSNVPCIIMHRILYTKKTYSVEYRTPKRRIQRTLSPQKAHTAYGNAIEPRYDIILHLCCTRTLVVRWSLVYIISAGIKGLYCMLYVIIIISYRTTEQQHSTTA